MRGILISPNTELAAQFTSAITARGGISLPKVLTAYPPLDMLSRVVRAWMPEVVFLDISEPASELIARRLENEFPSVLRVALHSSQEPAVFRRVLDWRMNELLIAPFEESELERTLLKLDAQLKEKPATVPFSDHLFAFIPAKAGVGASTIAANATWAFGESASNVLLADFDVSSGVTGFMFDVNHEFCLADAAQHVKVLDEDSWAKLVAKLSGTVDLLLSGAPRLEDHISPNQISSLLEFARRNYKIVNVDLPDNLNEASLTVLREANKIFLVLTPELPAVKLARLKILTFRKLELEDKIHVLVNRVSKTPELSNSEIEEAIGLPVYATFPCEYSDVTKAIRTGQPASRLSPSIRDFVLKVLERQVVKQKRSRFVERFGLIPMRYGFR